MIYSPNKTLHGNFKVYEVFKSRTADRLKIDNVPKGKELDAVLEVAEQACIHIIQPVREHFGIPFSPNSWFRCEQLERAICESSFYSWAEKRRYEMLTTDQIEDAWQVYFERKSHPTGGGIDFEIPSIDNLALYDWCKDNLPVYDQLIAEFMKKDDPTAGWVHGSHSLGDNRMQLIEIK